ncbi:MAG: phosphoglycerate dehydrogenase-like enzyme [Bacteroidia bacterium]|jgi:phosphoglycerate dehydrogenase-like enzyme
MKRYLHLFALFAGFLVLPASTLHAQGFDPALIINDLGLNSASLPISKKAGWAPKKIVAFIMPGLPQDKEVYVKALEIAGGEAEVIFAGGHNFSFSKENLADVDAILGLCSAALLKISGPKLRWLHNYSVGMDRCTGATPEQLDNITFTNNKRLSGPPIAEHSMAMLLALARDLPDYMRSQQSGKWKRKSTKRSDFGELSGKTMLVAGLGGIGTEVARRAHGMGMRVIATRNSSRTGPDFVDYVGLSDELHKLAAEADVVVNALPLTTSTTALFDKSFFDAVKPGAIFISVGRGKSTVTADLVAALQSKRLYGAGLDVTDPEPLPSTSPLWGMRNVIITPHVAANSIDSTHRSMVIAIENLRRYVAGEAMLNVVDLNSGY